MLPEALLKDLETDMIKPRKIIVDLKEGEDLVDYILNHPILKHIF